MEKSSSYISTNPPESPESSQINDENSSIEEYLYYCPKTGKGDDNHFSNYSSYKSDYSSRKDSSTSITRENESTIFQAIPPHSEENEFGLGNLEDPVLMPNNNSDYNNNERGPEEYKDQRIDEQEPMDTHDGYQSDTNNEITSTILNNSTKLNQKRRRERSQRKPKNPLLNFSDSPSNSKIPRKGAAGKSNARVYPKKEYYRVKIMRNWKKNLRKIAKGEEVPFAKFKANYNGGGSRSLDRAASTVEGPGTEGKNRSDKKKSDNKTNNNAYVRELFSNSVIIVSFKIFVIEYFEAFMKCIDGCDRIQHSKECITNACLKLCNKFKFSCCKNADHSSNCLDLWLRLKQYTYTGLVLQTEG